MYRFLISILFFSISLGLSAQEPSVKKKLDSINSLRDLAKDNTLSSPDRIDYAKLAIRLSLETKIDSTVLASQQVLSALYLNEEIYEDYRRLNYKNLKLANKLNDSSSIAQANRSLGWYHYVKSNSDSAYYYHYQAQKIFEKLGEIQEEAEVLLNMADIQETERDYVGSENNAIMAIKLMQTLPETEDNLDTLWTLHNVIGIVSENLENFDKALEYHELALDYSKKMKSSYINRIFSLNNIALVHRRRGEFDKAISYYKSLLEDNNLKVNSPETYALYLNNYAYTKYLSGTYDEDEILSMFWNSRKICDSLNYEFGAMSVTNDLARFYRDKNQIDSALYYSYETYNFAKKTNNNETLLETLIALSKIEDGDIGKSYLDEYVKLNDSLIQNERANRNKFARIEFETDQIKAENVQISRERLIFLLSSVGLLVTLILLYIIISQRAKNKELAFNQQQQEANEEIYNLMLAQQDKINEGRSKEKIRISEELHDGVLGRLFGTRLSLDSLNLQQTDDAVKTRGQYIEELKSIEQEIRKISHDLNTDFVSGSSFTDIIKTLIENQTQAYQLSYEYEEDDEIDWDALTNKTKIHVYRMLQETMQNIYKHANAKHIKISFQLKNNVILLMVEDDGDGFNTGKARKGIGLKNFDSRANEIGGKVEIFSKIGDGTRVKIHVPV